MLAMQYSFVLPADYDMSIIERRVQDKGHILDHYPPLFFKAYLMARKGDATTQSHENLYAPFYLWRDAAGMNDFLCGAGFLGLVNAFGWPAVRIWPSVIATDHTHDIARAQFATREIRPLAPFTPLDALRTDESDWTHVAVQQDGALLALSAFEPTAWTLVRFQLWREPQPLTSFAGAQAYSVLHVSNPSG